MRVAGRLESPDSWFPKIRILPRPLTLCNPFLQIAPGCGDPPWQVRTERPITGGRGQESGGDQGTRGASPAGIPAAGNPPWSGSPLLHSDARTRYNAPIFARGSRGVAQFGKSAWFGSTRPLVQVQSPRVGLMGGRACTALAGRFSGRGGSGSGRPRGCRRVQAILDPPRCRRPNRHSPAVGARTWVMDCIAGVDMVAAGSRVHEVHVIHGMHRPPAGLSAGMGSAGAL